MNINLRKRAPAAGSEFVAMAQQGVSTPDNSPVRRRGGQRRGFSSTANASNTRKGYFWAKCVALAAVSCVLVGMLTTPGVVPWKNKQPEVSREEETDRGSIRRLEEVFKKQKVTSFTLPELLEQKSFWRNSKKRTSGVADVTAILMVSPYLQRQLTALYTATILPKEVWVLMPAADRSSAQIVAQYQHKDLFGDSLHKVNSDLFSDEPGEAGVGGGDGRFFNAGLGRFQLAMQANTKFIWVIDPGVIPGRQFLDLLAHVSSTSEVGMFGGAGGLMPATRMKTWKSSHEENIAMVTPFSAWEGRGESNAAASHVPAAALGLGGVEIGGVGGTNAPSVMWPVDVLFNQWFLDVDLIRLVFREKWPWNYEELTLSYALRRYAGVQSYILPYDPRFPDTRPDVGVSSPEKVYADLLKSGTSNPFPNRHDVKNRSPVRANNRNYSRTGSLRRKGGHEPRGRRGSHRRLKPQGLVGAAGVEEAEGAGGTEEAVSAGGAERGEGSGSKAGERILRRDEVLHNLGEPKVSASGSRGSSVFDGSPGAAVAAVVGLGDGVNRSGSLVGGGGMVGVTGVAKDGANRNNSDGQGDGTARGLVDSDAAHESREHGHAGGVGIDGGRGPDPIAESAPPESLRQPTAFESALREPGFRVQFMELASRGGKWFWTHAQCSENVVMLVVDGARQAELLRPLYLELLSKNRLGEGGSDVFVAVISEGLQSASERQHSPYAPLPAASKGASQQQQQQLKRPTPPQDADAECMDVALALGLLPRSEFSTDDDFTDDDGGQDKHKSPPENGAGKWRRNGNNNKNNNNGGDHSQGTTGIGNRIRRGGDGGGGSWRRQLNGYNDGDKDNDDDMNDSNDSPPPPTGRRVLRGGKPAALAAAAAAVPQRSLLGGPANNNHGGSHENKRRRVSIGKTTDSSASAKSASKRSARQSRRSDTGGGAAAAEGVKKSRSGGPSMLAALGRNLEQKAVGLFGLGEADHDEGRASDDLPTSEEFCFGETFGVFKIRVGQDFTRAKGRQMDSFLDAYHSLSEVFTIVEPTMVAYISENTVERTAVGGALGASGGVGRGVVAAIEAAIRGTGPPVTPIGLPLPDTAAGAEAAKALAYLPERTLKRWKLPRIVLVLVHPKGASSDALWRSLKALKEAHFLGDSVELRLTLHGSSVVDEGVQHALAELDWTAGPLTVAYFHHASSSSSSSSSSGHIAALEAFSDAGVHDHVIPLFTGTMPHPGFYVQLKVALMNEGYSRMPIKGRPLDEGEKRIHQRQLKSEPKLIKNDRDEDNGEAFKNNDRYKKKSKTVKAFGKKSKMILPNNDNNNDNKSIDNSNGNGITAQGDGHGEEVAPPGPSNEVTITSKSNDGNNNDNDNKSNNNGPPDGAPPQVQQHQYTMKTEEGRRTNTYTIKLNRDKHSSPKTWGSALSLSVAAPYQSNSRQGMPATISGGTSTSPESSRVWMYGRDAWTALRERCRTAINHDRGSRVGGGGDGGRDPDEGEREAAGDTKNTVATGDGEVEKVDVACALEDGTVSGRGGRGGQQGGPPEVVSARGILVPKHVSGAWPATGARVRLRGRSGGKGDDWPRVVVWKLGS